MPRSKSSNHCGKQMGKPPSSANLRLGSPLGKLRVSLEHNQETLEMKEPNIFCAFLTDWKAIHIAEEM